MQNITAKQFSYNANLKTHHSQPKLTMLTTPIDLQIQRLYTSLGYRVYHILFATSTRKM